jgi:hypothetical protein
MATGIYQSIGGGLLTANRIWSLYQSASYMPSARQKIESVLSLCALSIILKSCGTHHEIQSVIKSACCKGAEQRTADIEQRKRQPVMANLFDFSAIASTTPRRRGGFLRRSLFLFLILFGFCRPCPFESGFRFLAAFLTF